MLWPQLALGLFNLFLFNDATLNGEVIALLREGFSKAGRTRLILEIRGEFVSDSG
jgi:hypothetical protein